MVRVDRVSDDTIRVRDYKSHRVLFAQDEVDASYPSCVTRDLRFVDLSPRASPAGAWMPAPRPLGEPPFELPFSP